MNSVNKVLLSVAALAFLTSTTAVGKKEQEAKKDKVEVLLRDSLGTDVGTAVLTKLKNGVKINLRVRHLPPGEHAFHIHEGNHCAPPDFQSAKGHFDPFGRKHGFETERGPHAGDMKNIKVAEDGTGEIIVENERVTLHKRKKGSLFANGGTTLVIHEKADDYESQPAGDAGKRIACGEIRRNELGERAEGFR